jgi:hypothetical protein
MLVDLGEEPRNKNATFTVAANIYSEQANEYIHHWDGGTFDNYDDAYDFWDQWEPSQNEIDQVMMKERENGDYSHHELEVGIWRNDPEESKELAFMNRTVDEEHERT